MPCNARGPQLTAAEGKETLAFMLSSYVCLAPALACVSGRRFFELRCAAIPFILAQGCAAIGRTAGTQSRNLAFTDVLHRSHALSRAVSDVGAPAEHHQRVRHDVGADRSDRHGPGLRHSDARDALRAAAGGRDQSSGHRRRGPDCVRPGGPDFAARARAASGTFSKSLSLRRQSPYRNWISPARIRARLVGTDRWLGRARPGPRADP
jgi:hypothetical protein